jgi:hypothetical protein
MGKKISSADWFCNNSVKGGDKAIAPTPAFKNYTHLSLGESLGL